MTKSMIKLKRGGTILVDQKPVGSFTRSRKSGGGYEVVIGDHKRNVALYAEITPAVNVMLSDIQKGLTPRQAWQLVYNAWAEHWLTLNPKPRADHPKRRAWAEKKERDRAAWLAEHPAPDLTSEEEKSLGALLDFHHRLCGEVT